MKVRVSTILIFSVALLSGTALLLTSQLVQGEEDRRQKLASAIAQEEESIRVLAAEWSYLNRPERLEALAAEYLGMGPPQAGQVLPSPAALPEPFVPILPRRKPSIAVRPASFSPAPSAPDPAPVSPLRKPTAPALAGEKKSFQALLQELDGKGAQ